MKSIKWKLPGRAEEEESEDALADLEEVRSGYFHVIASCLIF